MALGGGGQLVLEQDGDLHTLDPASGKVTRLSITVRGDVPWAEPRWENVAKRVSAASLGPRRQRALFEARGEIFTVPVEKGDSCNITASAVAVGGRLRGPGGPLMVGAWGSVPTVPAAMGDSARRCGLRR